MKPFLHLCFIAALCLLTTNAKAQVPTGVLDGKPDDSLIIDFSSTNPYIQDTAYFYIGSNSSDSLWQIGNTTKSFFSSGLIGNGLMTDTTNPYPANTNSSFYVRTEKFHQYNMIVTFEHKFEADPGKAGGIVEFSTDTGKTWMNVIGDCTVLGNRLADGIFVDNFYDSTDTLNTGEPAFTGTSNGWITSRFQFFVGLPVRSTGGGPQCTKLYPILRFRFASDTTTNAASEGWLISEIKIEHDYYGSSVSDVEQQQLNIYPNPAAEGIFNLPELRGESSYTIRIYDATGRKLIDKPYRRQLDMQQYQPGMYIYSITDEEYSYTGKLFIE